MIGEVGTIHSFFSTLIQRLSHLKISLLLQVHCLQARTIPYHSSSSSFQPFYVITLDCQQENEKKNTNAQGACPHAERDRERERERERKVCHLNSKRTREMGRLLNTTFWDQNLRRNIFYRRLRCPNIILAPCTAFPA